MDEQMVTAAYCGLYCKSCMLYIATAEDPQKLALLAQKYGKPVEELQCEGCRSEKLSFYCKTCAIKSCIREKGLDFCSQCEEYPCQTLIDFQAERPHRNDLFDSLKIVKEEGIDVWCEKMYADYSCPQCGVVNSAYDLKCRGCGSMPSSDYNRRHGKSILEAMQKTGK